MQSISLTIRMKKLLFFIEFGLLCLAVEGQTEIDPCDRPQFCDDDAVTADPTDCKSYFLCVRNQWARLQCPGVLTFDYLEMDCGPDAACHPECPAYTGPTTVPTTPMAPELCLNAPENCTEGLKYPDASSCFSYFECLDGDYVLRYCTGTEIVFDIYNLTCVAPGSNFDCNYRCQTPAPTTSLAPTTTHPFGIDPCDRPQFCDEGLILPDPENCRKYYFCVRSQWVSIDCQSIFTFDRFALDCIVDGVCYPECPLYTGPSTLPTTSADSALCPNAPEQCTEGIKYPDASSCFSYFECVDGEYALRFCSGTEFGFDIYNSTCVAPDSSFDCGYRCLTPAPTTAQPDPACNRGRYCNNGDILPDPEDCHHYFYCAFGHWGKVKCPSNLQFDANRLQCDNIHVSCHPGCPPTTPHPTLSEPPEPGPCSNVTECYIGQVFADRSSCVNYYECTQTNGTLQRQPCGRTHPLYVFNIEFMNCTEPDAYFDCSLRCLSED